MVTKIDMIADKKRVEYMLENYYKFLIVRDPLERLVSAFLHKWKRHDGTYTPITQRIAARYKNSTENLLEVFARNIIDNPFTKLDRHWTSYNTLCQPCAIKYDFVGKMETLDRDIAHVMKLNNVNETDYYIPPPSKHKTNAKSTTHDVLEELPDDLYQNLLQKFKLDLDMFGYPLPVRYHERAS